MLKISFISRNYILLFELKEYLSIILVISCSIFICDKKVYYFSFNKDENWFAILKTKLLAGNNHVIDIFTRKDMENISMCILISILTVNYI